jgi:DNA-damage-inducible protein D
VQTRLQEIQQMQEYDSLSSEEEKHIFLRAEMSKHNTYLAAAAKNASVQDGLDMPYFKIMDMQVCMDALMLKAYTKRKT